VSKTCSKLCTSLFKTFIPNIPKTRNNLGFERNFWVRLGIKRHLFVATNKVLNSLNSPYYYYKRVIYKPDKIFNL
jgi:hypothetical protein